MNQAEVPTRLRELAEQVIGTAGAILASVASGAEPTGIADPEAWHVKRSFARRILAAIDNGGTCKPTQTPPVMGPVKGPPPPRGA